jgi:hypothetical protein
MNWQDLLEQVRKPIASAETTSPFAPFADISRGGEPRKTERIDPSASFADGPGCPVCESAATNGASASFAYESGDSENGNRGTAPRENPEATDDVRRPDGEIDFSGRGGMYAKGAEASRLQAALDVIGRYGVRLLQVEGTFTIAANRTALGSPELMAAIKFLHADDVQVLDLGDPRIPERFRQPQATTSTEEAA